MQAAVEIYKNSIIQLSDKEQLELAALILEKVTRKGSEAETKKKTGDMSKFFGMYKGGGSDDSDNEKSMPI